MSKAIIFGSEFDGKVVEGMHIDDEFTYYPEGMIRNRNPHSIEKVDNARSLSYKAETYPLEGNTHIIAYFEIRPTDEEIENRIFEIYSKTRA